jgi:hypothetical protein
LARLWGEAGARIGSDRHSVSPDWLSEVYAAPHIKTVIRITKKRFRPNKLLLLGINPALRNRRNGARKLSHCPGARRPVSWQYAAALQLNPQHRRQIVLVPTEIFGDGVLSSWGWAPGEDSNELLPHGMAANRSRRNFLARGTWHRRHSGSPVQPISMAGTV